jgi:competence protein ComEC
VREPLLLPFAAFAAGIVLSQLAPFRPLECVCATAAFVTLTTIAYHRGARVLSAICSCLALILAGIWIDLVHRPGPAPELDAGSQETVILSGCVVQPSVFTEDRARFTLELEPGARANVSLALREGEIPPRLNYGQRIEIDAKVRVVRNFENPGAFDYVRYLGRQNVYWTASARAGAPIRTLPGRCGSKLLAGVFALRTAALDRLEQLYAGNSYAIGMTEAILLGESTKLEKVWTENFRRTGTYHALVISGLHVTVLAGVLLFFLRLCGLREAPSLAIAAAAGWVYAAVSGWSAPVIRAAGGFTLYLVARYFYRRGRVLNLVAAIAIVYLLYDPAQLFDASFQLSFFSVAAIGAFAIPVLDSTIGPYRAAPQNLSDRRRDLKLHPLAAQFRVELRLLAETVALWMRIPERVTLSAFGVALRFALWAVEMMVISAVVQVALALPMALYFHRFSITGLSANLLVVPLMSALVPVGFFAIFTGWKPIALVATGLLRAAEWVAQIHMRWEPSLRIPDPPPWLDFALVAALIVAAVGLRVGRPWRWAAMASALALFGVMLWSPFPPEIDRGRLEMTAIDVGQGDGLMLTLPGGKVILVDGGGIPLLGRRTKPRIDIGEDVVSPYLWARHIRKVDVIAITHGHEDHIGGVAALIANFRPSEIWTGASMDSPQWQIVFNAAKMAGARVIRRRAGEHIDQSRAHIDILAPAPDYVPGDKPGNNDSLAFRVSFGEHSFLLTGDMESPVETRLVSDGALAKTTVLKAPHHGSKTSDTELFLEQVQPAIAVISAGYENMFHHPHPSVLERLAAHHAAVLRTDLDGLVSVSTDGRRLTIHTMRRDYSIGSRMSAF